MLVEQMDKKGKASGGSMELDDEDGTIGLRILPGRGRR